jgi:hypothetical protein
VRDPAPSTIEGGSIGAAPGASDLAVKASSTRAHAHGLTHPCQAGCDLVFARARETDKSGAIKLGAPTRKDRQTDFSAPTRYPSRISTLVSPAPFGPSSPKTSPSAISKLTPRSASVSPYVLRRSRTTIAGPDAAAIQARMRPSLAGLERQVVADRSGFAAEGGALLRGVGAVQVDLPVAATILLDLQVLEPTRRRCAHQNDCAPV